MRRIILFSFLITSNWILGQTLETRWNRMLDKSYTYNAHKVIKREDLHAMYGAIHDSLLMAGVKVRHEQKQVQTQSQEIARLKEKQKAMEALLIQERVEKSQAISSKEMTTWYIVSLWMAVGVALVASAFFFFLYKRSNTIAFQKMRDHDELMKSFTEYKAQKLEMERKLKREIQTYANKFYEPKPRF